jgi:hypothetical protein
MFGFDLFAIIPSLFSQVFNFLSISEKSSKIKFLEKFWKNLIKFLCQKWGREAPRRPQGDPPCHPTTGGHGPSLVAPWHGEGGPGLSLISSSSLLSLSRNISIPQLKPMFLLLSIVIFRSPCSAHLCC